MAQMRICFIGDSFVSGAYDEDCIGWVGRIAAAARKRGHDLSPYNLGIRGETSVQIGRRWRAEAEPRQSPQQEGRLSPYRRAALAALRELTGLEAAPTAEAFASFCGEMIRRYAPRPTPMPTRLLRCRGRKPTLPKSP